LNNHIRRFMSNGWIFALGGGGQTLGILAFAFSSSYPLSLALLFLSGIGQACYNIMHSSIILLAASDEMRSRAMGAMVLASGIGPLGQLQIGALSDILGVPWAVRMSTLSGIAAIVIITLTIPDLYRIKDVGDGSQPVAYAKR
jgi:MFS family permease